MANELDELMDRDPLELSERDLDTIINYHRQRRAERAEGKSTKPKKEAGPKVDLSEILRKIAGDSPAPRPSTGVRRL